MSTVLDFIRGTITVSDGDSTATISGATSELFDRGTAVFVMDGNSILLPVQATAGATATTVDLLRPWDQGSVSGAQFVAFNTIEGLVRLLREVNALGNDLSVYADSFSELLTSTDPEVILELSGGDVTLTPWGYLKQQVEEQTTQIIADNQDRIDEATAKVDAFNLEQDLKRRATIYSDFAGNFHRLYNPTTKRIGETELEDNFTVTRTSAAWGFDPSGRLIEYAPNEPRLVIDPETGEPQGILIEEQRTNLVPFSIDSTNRYSNQTTNAAFNELGLSGQAAVFTPNPTSSQSSSSVGMTFTQGVTYSATVWVKMQSNEAPAFASLNPTARINYFSFIFARGGSNYDSIPEVKLLDAANKIYEITFVKTADQSVTEYAGPHRYAGNDKINETFEVLFYQIEEGAFATSPIITNGTAVTRTADNVTRTLGDECSDTRGTFTITANAKIGDVLLRCGSLEIVADVDGEKTYTASYTSALNATELEVCPDVPRATVSELTYEPS